MGNNNLQYEVRKVDAASRVQIELVENEIKEDIRKEH
jgi:hypothetical protein